MYVVGSPISELMTRDCPHVTMISSSITVSEPSMMTLNTEIYQRPWRAGGFEIESSCKNSIFLFFPEQTFRECPLKS